MGKDLVWSCSPSATRCVEMGNLPCAADGRDTGWVQLAQNQVLVERRRNCVFTFSPELSCSSPCRSRDQYFLMRLSRVRRDSVVLLTRKYERRGGDRAAKFRSGAFQRSNSCTRRGTLVSRASCFKVPTCCSERELAATATTRRKITKPLVGSCTIVLFVCCSCLSVVVVVAVNAGYQSR